MQDRERHQAIFNATTHNIDLAEAQGVLDPETAEAHRLQAIEDLNTRLLEEAGVDDYVTNYSQMHNFAEFGQTALSSVLLGLIDEEYESLEDGIAAIAEASDISEEDVAGILSGELIPDVDCADSIAQAFESTSTNEDAYLGLQSMALDARNELVEDEDDLEDLSDYFSYDGGDEEEEYYEYDDEDEEEYEEGEDSEELANHSAELHSLKNQIAEFEYERQMKDRLDNYISQADELVNNHQMFPVEFDVLFGQLPDLPDSQQVAAFSAFSEKNGMDDDTQAKCIEFCLAMCAKRGQIFPGGQFSRETLAAEQEANFNASEDELIRQSLELYKASGHL